MAAGIAEAVKQDIVSIIKSVQPVGITGNVYDRVKYSSSWQNFKEQFLYADPVTGYTQVRGWWVTLPTLRDDEQGRSFDMHWHILTYPIHAVMGYSDKGNSESAFDTMIWSTFDLLHDQGVLGHGPSNPVIDSVGNPSFVIDASVDIEVPTVDMRMFGSMLCHHAEFRMSVGIADSVLIIP